MKESLVFNRHVGIRMAWVLASLVAVTQLAACSAIEVTTRRGLQGTTAVGKASGYTLKATGNASVTPPNVPRLAEATAFFESQRRFLARQAAAGGGEDIAALARLLNKREPDRVARWMQAHYSDLFSDRSVKATTVILRIDAQTI